MLSALLWAPLWEARLSTCGVRGCPPTCAQLRPPDTLPHVVSPTFVVARDPLQAVGKTYFLPDQVSEDPDLVDETRRTQQVPAREGPDRVCV